VKTEAEAVDEVMNGNINGYIGFDKTFSASFLKSMNARFFQRLTEEDYESSKIALGYDGSGLTFSKFFCVTHATS